MKRPAIQFYTGDWKRNANLRRCTFAERGIWIEVMCLLHDSDEYGLLRWPLEELANAVGCRVADLQALRRKEVLKGADLGETFPGHSERPRHAGKEGAPVELIPAQPGPLWFSSRMVWDEHKRRNSGGDTRFSAEDSEPRPSPSRGHGDGKGTRLGSGASSSSSASTTSPSLRSGEASHPRKIALPEDFALTDADRQWATKAGYGQWLEVHFAYLVDWANADRTKRRYTDWHAVLRNCVRADWGDVRRNGTRASSAPQSLPAKWRPGGEPTEVLRAAARALQIEPWQEGETQGQFRARIIACQGGEDLLKPGKLAA